MREQDGRGLGGARRLLRWRLAERLSCASNSATTAFEGTRDELERGWATRRGIALRWRTQEGLSREGDGGRRARLGHSVTTEFEGRKLELGRAKMGVRLRRGIGSATTRTT